MKHRKTDNSSLKNPFSDYQSSGLNESNDIPALFMKVILFNIATTNQILDKTRRSIDRTERTSRNSFKDAFEEKFKVIYKQKSTICIEAKAQIFLRRKD